MRRIEYSVDLCRSLTEIAEKAELHVTYRPRRYDQGDVLDLELTTAWPEIQGKGRFRIERFVGGGFAGQVYRCVLEELDLSEKSSGCGLKKGGVYAVKIMVPPTRFSRFFRNLLYRIAFQAPFSPQVNKGACRAGLLWRKMGRVATRVVFGREDAVADAYASFYDSRLNAYGEVGEWVEGRVWRLESDTTPWLRKRWKTRIPQDSGSPEYVAKHQFMDRIVGLLHEMGAVELARQYEWWTMKSQPNVLKRVGYDSNPGDGLCAVDFRAGLALVPFIPMNPRDITLILQGIGRGSFAQFDRFDYRKLRDFTARFDDDHTNLRPMVDEFIRYDREYRRSMPDITHHGLRLLFDSSLRRDIRKGLVDGYSASDLVDDRFAERLVDSPVSFTLFYILGCLPVLGRFVRRLWGNTRYRQHVWLLLSSREYFRLAVRAGVAGRLVEWHRLGRTSEKRTDFLLRHPWIFWLQRFTIGLLPRGLHRLLAEPSYVAARVRETMSFIRSFYRDANFRERWLSDLVHEGYKDGMLDEAERDAILTRIRDPFIVKYLKSLAIHFATLPVTQIVSVIVGGIVAILAVLSGATWASAGVRFAVVLGIFQVTPISPGSICRGVYVVYLMIREKDIKNYLVAAPISFVKYLGYLAFPFQMVTTYPALSRFMASRWATNTVRIVPVFGEKGALLEHMVFDLFFNFPRVFAIWAKGRIRGLLDIWLLLGTGILYLAFGHYGLGWSSPAGINLILGVLALFILPRILYYPILRRQAVSEDKA